MDKFHGNSSKEKQKATLCLDPKDLNHAIQREHYPLPTIEDIATRLHGTKVFTKLDVRNGFWHVALDEDSLFLTTFYTPFGRYRWRRLPFGISSAPEVLQRKTHELIDGLSGMEVVADDFIAEAHWEKPLLTTTKFLWHFCNVAKSKVSSLTRTSLTCK